MTRNSLQPPKLASGSELDALVVGGGLGGLLVSAILLQRGRKVHLSEKLSQTGGRLSPEKRAGFTLGAGFSFGDAAWWRALADRLGISSPTLPIAEGKALVHSTRGWVNPEDLPDWEASLSENCSEYPVGGAYGINESLFQYCSAQPGFSVSFESPVTALKIKEDRIHSVSLGTDIEVLPKDVYWCADYKTLLESFTGPGAPEMGPERVSWLKRFRKTDPQPGVVLEFAHKTKLGDFTESLLLPFSAQDKGERRYLVGAIVSNRDPSLAPSDASLSSWILPVTEAEWADNHETMKKIRSARRLIEKAFPAFEASVQFERVLVLESTVSPLSKKKGDWKPLLPNLFLTADWAIPTGATLPNLAEAILHLP